MISRQVCDNSGLSDFIHCRISSPWLFIRSLANVINFEVKQVIAGYLGLCCGTGVRQFWLGGLDWRKNYKFLFQFNLKQISGFNSQYLAKMRRNCYEIAIFYSLDFSCYHGISPIPLLR